MKTTIKTTAAAALAALLLAGPAAAEGKKSPTLEFKNGWTLKLDGQYRIRAIADTGLDFADAAGRQNISHRARLGSLMTTDQGVQVRFLLQDVRL